MKQITQFLLATALLSSTSSAAPRLEISEPEFNFGFVPQHADLSHDFWLYSTGDDSLKITRIVPGCSCTKTPLEKENMAAGDSTLLHIMLDTKTFTRKITKGPRIWTNENKPESDAMTPDTFIMVHADVMIDPLATTPITIKPFKLDLTPVGKLVRDKMTFTLTNTSATPLKPTLVVAPTRFMEVTLPETIPAGGSATGTIELKKEYLNTSIACSFTFQLDDALQTRFTVPVKRTVVSPANTATDIASNATGKK